MPKARELTGPRKRPDFSRLTEQQRVKVTAVAIMKKRLRLN